MEKWDWRIGLAIELVPSELAVYWPRTSTAPRWGRGWDPAGRGLTLSEGGPDDRSGATGHNAGMHETSGRR